MASFRCRVSNERGTVRTLVRTAPSADILSRELSTEGFYVIAIDPAGSSEEGRPRGLKRSLVRDFTDSLSTLLASGLSLADALQVQQTVFPSGEGSRLVAFLRARVERGDALSSALTEVGRGFPPVYCGLVAIGERIGSLRDVIARLSGYLRKQKQIRDKVIGSLTYPAIVLFVAVAGVAVIGTVVLPRVREMFDQLGDTVPEAAIAATQSLAGFAVAAAAVLAAVILTVIVGLAARRGAAAAKIDAIILRIPLVGPFLLRQELLNFVFAMETLTDSGVTVESAIAEASSVFHNAALRAASLRLAERVAAGIPLSAGFAGDPVFPARLSVWAGIGERTGNAAGVFGQLRLYYEEDVNRWVERFMNLIEPALIVLVGVAMLILVVTFVVPLFGVFGTVL